MAAAVPGERTALAWQRTGWTALAAGGLILHAAPGWPGAAAGIVLLVGGIACTALVAPLRLRALAAASAAGRAVAAPGAAAATAAVVVLVGLLAVGAVLLP